MTDIAVQLKPRQSIKVKTDNVYVYDPSVIQNLANKDLSNLSATGEAKFDAKQDVISDLSTIRSGAALGATAVQPSDLSTVATSGSYNDLLNKPTIPTVNNATLTITQGGVSKGTFTANASSDVTIELDAGGGGGSAAWGDITGDIDDQTDLKNALSAKADSSSLASVATSGLYSDLSGIPTIPTDTGDLTNGAGFITGITSGDVTTALGYTPLSPSDIADSVDSSSTNSKTVGAKLFYDTCGDIETLINAL